MLRPPTTAARYDGLWVVRTNTVYNAETVAHVYKALWTVEDIIRTTKSIMDTKPIYHRCNEPFVAMYSAAS